MTAVECIFWFFFSLLLYIYAGYPLLVAVLARLFSRPVNRAPFTGTCSFIMAARNEADRLLDKIESLQAQTAARNVLEILVGSDGSTDETVQVLKKMPDPRIRTFDFPVRRGKPAVLNALMRECSGDVVVLCDARQRLDPQALELLLAPFADPEVGVVSGELVFLDPMTSAAVGIDAYWSYEKWIRKAEALFHSVPGATGALYAIRRNLLKPIPPETILDDVAIPMQAVMAGGRCIFEAGAKVYDAPSSLSSQESIRKRRTIAGVVQLIGLYPAWLFPWRNPIWFSYVSHKILRLFSPLCLIGLMVINVYYHPEGIYQMMLVLQVIFYAMALLGWLLRRFHIRAKALSIPMMFVSLNITTLLAWWDAVRGKYRVVWEQAYTPSNAA